LHGDLNGDGISIFSLPFFNIISSFCLTEGFGVYRIFIYSCFFSFLVFFYELFYPLLESELEDYEEDDPD
jgi:hypothetical protein